MKMTRSPRVFLKSASDTIFPSISGSEKSGAFVPSGNIVEEVATIEMPPI
jgi:hypothetical protein